MSSAKGPRRLVLNDLNSFNSPRRVRVAADDEGIPPAGVLKVHSYSRPGLEHGSKYTITAKQDISYVDSQGQETTEASLSTTKDIRVQGSRSSLDPALIHSVYPPPGHTDYWNVLPHVLYSNRQVPWMMDFESGKNQPWLALLVFTHDELTLWPDDLKKLKSLTQDGTATPITQNATLAVPMTYEALKKCARFDDSSSNVNPSAGAQAIFVNKSTFAAIFSKDRRFDVMSHVRTMDSKGMAGLVDNSGSYAVSVSPRPGPRFIYSPTAVYAHLITLPSTASVNTDLSVCGLVSLYSWSYTCLPSTSFAMKAVMQTLEKSIQPLRVPDSRLDASQEANVSWIKSRMRAGYNMVRYRPSSGETTMAVQRGPLIPTNPYSVGDPAIRDMPKSNFGSDLAILDREVGILDITFQLAWELGRSLAMADRTFSSAVMRVKSTAHTSALCSAKTQLDKESTTGSIFVPIHSAVGSFPSVREHLQNSSRVPSSTLIDSRWQRPSTDPGSRAQYSFVHDSVKAKYATCCLPATKPLAMAAPVVSKTVHVSSANSQFYNEMNCANSVDYANVLRWVLDKWFLSGIPILNLIPDPLFVPKESIRSFYIDPTWMKCFVDGALSISERFTEGDDIRESIKECLSCCMTMQVNGKAPRIPKWGFFLRSELVLKFRNLRISAPMTSADGGTEALRWDVIDDDLIVALFDRVPGTSSFPSGISIGPPGHQLSFSIGEIHDWSKSDIGVESLIIHRKIFKDELNHTFVDGDPLTYTSDASPSGFNFDYNIINTAQFTADANMKERGDSLSIDSEPAMVGVQLIAAHPLLTLDDASPTQLGSLSPDVVTTTAKTNVAVIPFVYSANNVQNMPATAAELTDVPLFPRPKSELLALLAYGVTSQALYFNRYLQSSPPRGVQTKNVGVQQSPDPQNPAPLPNMDPGLDTSVYNLTAHVMSYPFVWPGGLTNVDLSTLYAVTPQDRIRCPQNIEVRSKMKSTMMIYGGGAQTPAAPRLSSVRYAFKIGPLVRTKDSTFSLFDTIPSQPATVTIPPASRSGEDFQHQTAKSTHLGPIIPKVRNVGIGKRWLLQTKYPDPDVDGQFTVTAIPNRGDLTPGKYAWELTQNLEIHFVIEAVHINWWSNIK